MFMSYLVRKISRPKWEQEKILPEGVEDVSADVFSQCIVTKGSALSVWHSESDKWGDFDDILAALFTTLDGPTRLDVVVLDESDVASISGVEIKAVPGDTKASQCINNKHRDLVNLKISSITGLARLILESLKEGNGAKVKRFNDKEVLKKVCEFIDRGEVDEELLGDRWKRKINVYRQKNSCE